MRLAAISAALIIAAAGVLTLLQLWTGLLAPGTFWKVMISLAVLLALIIVIALIVREYLTEKRQRDKDLIA